MCVIKTLNESKVHLQCIGPTCMTYRGKHMLHINNYL